MLVARETSFGLSEVLTFFGEIYMSFTQDDCLDDMIRFGQRAMSQEFARLTRAIIHGATKHAGQLRKDGVTPYFNHCLRVLNLLANAGVGDVDVLCAAVLHDTVEDTDTTIANIRRNFGSRVADLVAEVTDDRSLSKRQRKAMQVRKARHMSDGAKLIKLADKYANVWDLIYAPPPWSKRRMQAYVNFASKVVNAVRDVNAQLAAMFDALVTRFHNGNGRARQRSRKSISGQRQR